MLVKLTSWLIQYMYYKYKSETMRKKHEKIRPL